MRGCGMAAMSAGSGNVGVERAAEVGHVGGVRHVIGVRVQRRPRRPQILRGGDHQVGPAGEGVVVGAHHLRVDEAGEGGVLVHAVVHQRDRLEPVDQRHRGGQVGPQQVVAEPQAPRRPAHVAGQPPLVQPVHDRAHVAEGEKGRRSEGPQPRLGPPHPGNQRPPARARARAL